MRGGSLASFRIYFMNNLWVCISRMCQSVIEKIWCIVTDDPTQKPVLFLETGFILSPRPLVALRADHYNEQIRWPIPCVNNQFDSWIFSRFGDPVRICENLILFWILVKRHIWWQLSRNASDFIRNTMSFGLTYFFIKLRGNDTLLIFCEISIFLTSHSTPIYLWI